jgi:putative transposase
MRNSKYSDKEIHGFVQAAENGVTIDEICHLAQVSARTFYRWRRRFGGLRPAALRAVRELEMENRRLRTIVGGDASAGCPPRADPPARPSLRSDVGCAAPASPAKRVPTVIGRFASIRVRP